MKRRINLREYKYKNKVSLIVYFILRMLVVLSMVRALFRDDYESVFLCSLTLVLMIMVDADCVGVLEDNIDWKLNKQWLDLLAKSGTPLFVSVQPKALTDEMKADLVEAFKISAIQTDVAEPVDWKYNNQPQRWMINQKLVEYDFIMDSYPYLLDKKTQP